MPIFGGKDAKVESLRAVLIFSHCSDKDLKFIASEMDEVSVEAGEKLITQGSRNHAFNIIIEGEAEVQIDGQVVKTLGAGDFFGEISMMDRGAATATVVATKPSQLMVMSHGQFRDAVRADDDIYDSVMAAIGQRLREIGVNRAERATH